MDSIKFIANYNYYLDELSDVIREEYQHVLEVLRNKDPHDIVTPDRWFSNEIEARGLVWVMFLNQLKKSKTISAK
ncbi:hypothetical protein MM239_12330 [Belliella sp. DSM 111904]|uniref:Uncharacterized protein n=1 Tax=Belliella filtrata TaxID=2923435 RepID=A0ABS9V187_9BACT|nr:hypothetical protein [Belliella filtrata]MCH7410186.1 hypothetical protein [Belliella filtrata]